jgi:hypothetical protein
MAMDCCPNGRSGFFSWELFFMQSSLELHPLPLVASFLFSHFKSVYVYAFREDRWCLTADGKEWWLIDRSEGLQLIENPF